MKRLPVIQILGAVVITLSLSSCQTQASSKTLDQLHQDLSTVADSISHLMSDYLYNPAELATDDYLALEQQILVLAKTVQSNQEFANGFNEFWKDGPFSHVTLTMSESKAEEMAEYLDTLRVGDQSVSLEWIERTAILTVNTMMGLDTKERVSEAYREIAKNETESLIIDLRNNTGGTFAGVPLIGHVLTDTIDAGIFVSRQWWENNAREPKLEDVQVLMPWEGWSLRSFWNDVQEEPLTRIQFKPMYPHFDGPVYVLTSKKTASAAEFTADAFAHEEQVTIIGQNTAGELLSQKMFDLPFGFQLSLPIADYYSHRIGRIEGKGVVPDIAIDQSVALELAFALINGETLEDAIKEVQVLLDEMKAQPLGEAIYLLGSMNEWGQDKNATPQFEYKGKGVYETTIMLKKGQYEFKIAPMNWDFDFGAKSNQENIRVGQKSSLSNAPGSGNLILNIADGSGFLFNLTVSNNKAATLQILKH